MGRIRLFPTPEYTSKQPSDPVVPKVPCTCIFLGPLKSGNTVALISLILEQYSSVCTFSVRGRPSSATSRRTVNTEREQAYWDDWDKAALRRIKQQQRKITNASVNMQFLCCWRLRNQHELDAILEELRPAAKGPAAAPLRAGHQGALQLPLRLLPEAEARDVPHTLRAALRVKKPPMGPALTFLGQKLFGSDPAKRQVRPR